MTGATIAVIAIVFLVLALVFIVASAVCPDIEIDETDEEFPGVQ